ncbi:MAG: redox-sensing transcriptional repressor Rex [Planctomycetota bacterium]
MFQTKVPLVTVKRLALYLTHLGMLVDAGVKRISSEELANEIGVSASLVRRDLSHFGKFGISRSGYDASILFERLRGILGINTETPVVIIGAGHIGQALAHSKNLDERGFRIKGLFDIDTRLIGKTVDGIQIRAMSELNDVVKKTGASIGVIAVPANAAQRVADRLVAAGIEAIWNFAPLRLVVPEHTIVENVHLAAGLLSLTYRIRERHGIFLRFNVKAPELPDAPRSSDGRGRQA